MKKTIIILIIIVIIIGGWIWSSYNKLITSNESVENSWAQVETQYQRRFDLIPNLVSAVKGIMNQEEKIFGDLAEARTRYSGATNLNEKVAAASGVESALGRLLVIMENYPELKSANTVQDLMSQLEGTENRISVARTRFNDQVKTFNVMIKRVPRNMIANWFNFEEKTYFEIAPEAATVPQVNLE